MRGDFGHEPRFEPCLTYADHWFTKCNVSQMSFLLDLHSLDILHESDPYAYSKLKLNSMQCF